MREITVNEVSAVSGGATNNLGGYLASAIGGIAGGMIAGPIGAAVGSALGGAISTLDSGAGTGQVCDIVAA